MKHATFFFVLSSVFCSGQFQVPDWRSSEGSTHAEWDVFTEPKFVANSPDVVSDDATILCTTGSAFLTGGGNIYSFQAPTAFQLDDSVEGPVSNIFLQVQTLGSRMDLESARIIYKPDPEGAAVTIWPRLSVVACAEPLTGEFGGVGVIYNIQWDLRPAPITGSYSILFNAASSSMSLDKVSLDTSAEYTEIPEPKPLSVEIINGEVVVTWACPGQLQMSTTLEEDGWIDVSEATGKRTITMPISSAPTFFRLNAEGSPDPG